MDKETENFGWALFFVGAVSTFGACMNDACFQRQAYSSRDIKQEIDNVQSTAKRIEIKIGDMERKVNDTLKLYVENVRDGPEPEKFYIINGERAYLEIDGKSVEEYFKK